MTVSETAAPPKPTEMDETDFQLVKPQVGMIVWSVSDTSGKLEKVKILRQEGTVHGLPVWIYQWLTGPDKDGSEKNSGRLFWMNAEAASKENLYEPLLRPPQFGGMPSGVAWEFVAMPHNIAHNRPDLPKAKNAHGVIKTLKPLTKDQCERFDLRPVKTVETAKLKIENPDGITYSGKCYKRIASLEQIGPGSFLVKTKFHGEYRIEGGKKLGGSRSDWFLDDEPRTWKKSISIRGLVDGLNLIESM